ncbi:conserved hypothetical protein [Nitrosococcus halophilus Nc 4]|uniref:Uncharacterized protein n=1 Tax=Nitrosococcus halophilus (strain Nc4) TaxID=472759 RepID=D5C356_NITHN|nr:hypothetical protein [Nitrosococcus halophilus]ADE14948.1 conserved hypothetical protein [Nitrosococcus halophilus Nc 4]ADE14964.1 conserved hypothetical protein [Nitrosococcus halophilus Nc 4]
MGSKQEADSETRARQAETQAMQEWEEHEVREEENEAMEMTEKAYPRKKLTLDEMMFYGLLILSVVGVAITQSSVIVGRAYWLAMIPIIAATTLYVEWIRGRGQGMRWRTLLRTQLFHWGALLVSVELVYMLFNFGRLSNEAVSLMILLLLAQTTFQVGVYVDWRFSIVALFQAFSLIVLAYLKAYIWIILLVAIGIIALGIYFRRKFPEKFSFPHRSRF